jgi:hypothetical protein
MRHRPRTSFSKYDANKSVDPASRSEGDRADAELLLATEQSNQEIFFNLPRWRKVERRLQLLRAVNMEAFGDHDFAVYFLSHFFQFSP